jgi:hypothetical protein
MSGTGVASLPTHLAHQGRKVLIKYHKLRSGHGRHPPNSMPALEEVVMGGAAAIEFDIGMLGDGGYALLHDARLELETNGAGSVSQTFVAKALEDGFDPIDAIHRLLPDSIIDVWTLNSKDPEARQELGTRLPPVPTKSPRTAPLSSPKRLFGRAATRWKDQTMATVDGLLHLPVFALSVLEFNRSQSWPA